MVALTLVAIVLSALTADFVVLWLRRHQPAPLPAPQIAPGIFVAPEHVWLLPEVDGLLTVGADAMAGLLFGKPERIDWHGPGLIKRGEALAILHGGARRLTLRSPVDGVVVERHADMDPAALVQEPFGAGWLVRMRPYDLQSSLAHAHRGERLREWSRRELDRLRSFVLARLPRTAVGATAADGGALAPELLWRLDEETWTQAAALVFESNGRDGTGAPS